jgi:SLAP domain-containing protein
VATKAPETEAPVIVTEAPVVENTNYFFNDANNVYDANSISIKPRYVYWDGGKLVAECFVINGFGHTVYNINVKSLSFANPDGDIASAAFGSMDGVTIAPYSHVIWTFTFGEDCVVSPGADLSSLKYKSSTSNSY